MPAKNREQNVAQLGILTWTKGLVTCSQLFEYRMSSRCIQRRQDLTTLEIPMLPAQ